MKKRTSILTGVFLYLLGVISCTQDDPQQTDVNIRQQGTSVPSVLYGAEMNGRKIPDGTTTRLTNNGTRVELTFPKGIKFVSVRDGKLNYMPATCYECTGQCSEGCDVLYVNDKFGCNQCDNGSSCTGRSIECPQHLHLATKGGFVNLHAGISFAKASANLERDFLQGPGIDLLMQIPEVAEAMKAFDKRIFGTENPDYSAIKGGTRPYLMNVFGTPVIYHVPESYVASARLSAEDLYSIAPGDEITCDCRSGSSGCEYDSGLGWKGCISGDCVTCMMKVVKD